MKKILVVGSLNMDYTIYCEEFPKDGETIYGIKRIVQPGGKGANQAAAAAKSHLVPVTFISSRGNDNDGITIENMLKELGIAAKFKINEGVETGNATIDVNSHGENKIIIIAGANALLKPSDISKEDVINHDYVILQNEIPNETNEHVMRLAKENNKVVVYNPAPYREIKDELYSLVDYFVVNEVELMRYSGKEDIEEGIKILLSKGVKNLIVTLGTDGSMFVNNETRFKVAAHKVKAVDTVAAGDTYIGYFTAGLAKGKTTKEAMELASKASALTVTKQGSIISIPFGEEI